MRAFYERNNLLFGSFFFRWRDLIKPRLVEWLRISKEEQLVTNETGTMDSVLVSGLHGTIL
jgi:hypothetical protein